MQEFKKGMIFSGGLHLTLVVVGLVGLPVFLSDDTVEPTIVPIEMVEIDDVARSTEPQPKAAPSKYEPPTTRNASAPSSSAAPAAETAKPVPMPEPNIRKRLKPAHKPEPKKIIPKVEPRAKPRPPSRLDRSRLAALIDKSKKESTDPQTKPDEDVETEDDKPQRMSPLEAKRATMTIIGAIQRQIAQCWSIPAGAKDAANLIIPIRIQLTPEGELIGIPDILDTSRMEDGYYRVAAEAATRAIRRCAPFELPKDKYDMWRDIKLNFNPGEMLGGG